MKLVLLFLFIFLFLAAPAHAGHLVPKPVTTFSASALRTTPGQSLILSWTTTGVSGVNVQISCSEHVFVTSPSFTGNFPCEKPVFSSQLEANNSLKLNFTNSAPEDKTISFLLLVSSDGKTYDALHGSSLIITAASDIIPDPVINFFNASSTSIYAGDPLSISWSASYVNGVNIKFPCRSEVNVATSSAENASTMPCDTYAFLPDLPQNGTRTLFLQTANQYNKEITFTLIPVLPNGGYDLTRRRTLSITVRPAAITAAQQTIMPPQSQIPAAPTTTAPQSPKTTPTPVPPPAPSPITKTTSVAPQKSPPKTEEVKPAATVTQENEPKKRITISEALLKALQPAKRFSFLQDFISLLKNLFSFSSAQ